MSCNTRWLEGS